MNFINVIFQKTAALSAVFCFLSVSVVFAQESRTLAQSSLDTVKKKAINLMMQSQKKQALSILSDFIATENNKAKNKEAREYRLSLAKKFLNKEAQEAYEMSLNLTLENAKASKKHNEDCLARDPENMDCLIQRARLIYRERKAPLKLEESQALAIYFDTPEINWVKLSSEKSLPEFKSHYFFKKDGLKLSENRFVLAVLEIERSLAAKNFSKAKDILSLVEKEYSDWPEHVYFKNQIDVESTENKTTGAVDFLNQYKNKCKNLSKSTVRKYRYDYDLCIRGI